MGMRIEPRLMAVSMGAVLLTGLTLMASAAAAEHVREQSAADRLTAAGIRTSTLAPGWTVQGDEIVWDNGAVTVSIGPATYADCDRGYLCVWQDKDYTGRRLQFKAVGLRGNMHDFDFNDKMSSWRNRNNKDSRWYYNYNGSGKSRCMNSGSGNPDVGAGASNFDNDEMSSLRIYPDARTC